MNLLFDNDLNPHGSAKIAMSGVALDKAKQVLILIHGRGATAQSMFALGELVAKEETTLLAPQADDSTWYPYSFLADEEMNEPYLSSAINLLDDIVKRLLKQGFKENQISLLGFSQGACLSLEFAARTGYAFNYVAGLSGGLIGETLKTERYQVDLSKQRIFLGCSDIDAHIPVERVHETAKIFEERGAKVDKRIYEGMGHHVNEDEIEGIKKASGVGSLESGD